MYNGEEQFHGDRYPPLVVDHPVYVVNGVHVHESFRVNSFGEFPPDIPEAKLALPGPKSGLSYTRQDLPSLNLSREFYTAPNYVISPASSFQYSPESEGSPDHNHFQSDYPGAPHPHYPPPISGTDFSGSLNDAALAHQEVSGEASLYHYNDTTSATFPPDEGSPESYYSPYYGGHEQSMHHGIQAANDVTLYLAHESKQSDIMIDDKRTLLKLMGCVDYQQHSALIPQLFTEKLLASTCSSTSNGALLGSKGLCGRPMKAKISSDAGKAASADRRKVDPSFFCELRGVCGASFTRKNGLINHYKAHLGITDRFCRYCSQAFTTSVGRHERKCKQNPDHRQQKPSPSMYMMAPLAGYY